MKQLFKDFLLSMLVGLVIPAFVLSVSLDRMDADQERVETQMDSSVDSSYEVHWMRLRSEDGRTREMEMDTYLLGVLLAEMPSDFAHEAKCAQAVVARTYTQKAYITGGKHGDGSVCTDAACCQAYRSPEDFLAAGGTHEAVTDAMSAVTETSGYVLTYDGDLIEATYFSCSGGRTEDAVAVWGTDYPYLRATDSPGEENALHNTDTVEFSAEEFCNCLGQTPSGEPSQWFTDIEYTDGGGVASIRIGEISYSGTKIRALLGLRSTAFRILVEGKTIFVTTRGFGHRVGMSQYGANAMAENGSGYADILAHYYSGSKLSSIDLLSFS